MRAKTVHTDGTTGHSRGPARIGPGGLFEPDILLAVQSLKARVAQPEKLLLIALLEDAIDRYRKYALLEHDPVAVAITAFERAWFLSDDEMWPCAFVPICHQLGLEPDAVRAKVLAPVVTILPKARRAWAGRHVVEALA